MKSRKSMNCNLAQAVCFLCSIDLERLQVLVHTHLHVVVTSRYFFTGQTPWMYLWQLTSTFAMTPRLLCIKVLHSVHLTDSTVIHIEASQLCQRKTTAMDRQRTRASTAVAVFRQSGKKRKIRVPQMTRGCSLLIYPQTLRKYKRLSNMGANYFNRFRIELSSKEKRSMSRLWLRAARSLFRLAKSAHICLDH
jgi:hypothetical protein